MYRFTEQKWRWRAVALLGDDGDLAPIPGYEFSEELALCAAALYAEIPGLREEFRTEAIRLRTERDVSAVGDGLLRELAECVLVLRLNSHLADYFRDAYAPPGHRPHPQVDQLSRDHFGEVLKSNRPLRVITEDIAQRPIFTRHPGWAGVPTDDVGCAGGPGDAYFVRLAPDVPRGTTVGRDSDGAIRLDTPHLRLRLRTLFRGFNTHVPTAFLREYAKVDVDPPHGVRPYEVIIDVDATPKPRLGTAASRRVRRGWLEDFLADSQDKVDFDAFLTAIDWRTVAAVLRCLTPDDRFEARRQG